MGPKKIKLVLTREQKKARKLERKKARILLRRQKKENALRDFLSRELKYGLQNSNKLSKKWREKLVQFKSRDLGFEFDLATINAEYMLDNKDFIISLLMDELKDAQTQSDLSFGAHCHKIDDLYKIFLNQLHDLKYKYDTEIEFIANGISEEINTLKENALIEKQYLNDLKFGDHKNSENLEYEATVSRLKYVEEMIQEYRHDELCSEGKFVKKFVHFWNIYKNTIQSYQIEASAKIKIYDEFEERNKEYTKDITHNRDKLFNKYVHMKKEKDRQETQQEKHQEKIDSRISEVQSLKIVLENVKKKTAIEATTDQSQLLMLVKYMEATNKKLGENVELLEKILTMYSLIRKYETEKEKILPFRKMAPEHLPKGYRMLDSSRNVLGSFSIQLVRFTNVDLKELSNFWQRVANSDKLRNCINEEMEVLISENRFLRRYVLNCLHADPSKLHKISRINMKMLCQ